MKKIIFLCLYLSLTLLLTNCSDETTKKIVEEESLKAEQELLQAKTLGAEEYAAFDFSQAEDKLEEAKKYVELKQYKQAETTFEEFFPFINSAKEKTKNALDAKKQAELYKKEQERLSQLAAEEEAKIQKQKEEESFRKNEMDAQKVKDSETAKKLNEQSGIITTPDVIEKIPTGDYYVVVKGDYLWKLAENIYGNGEKWKSLYRLNQDKIYDPNVIYPNQKLILPKK